MSLLLKVLYKSHTPLVFGIQQKRAWRGKTIFRSVGLSYYAENLQRVRSVRMWERYESRVSSEGWSARYNAAFCGGSVRHRGSGAVRYHRGGECSSAAHRVAIARLNP